jgi:hypothetical protein
VGDYHVDRPGVEGEQSLELTGTNSPETFKFTQIPRNRPVHESSSLCSFPPPSSGAPARRGVGIRFLAAIALGFHPFPSRTRQLSPTASMVVGPQGPSRVERR